MGINKNDATSFEEMAEEQVAQETPVAAEPVAEATEPTEAGDKCDCTDCDCKETPKAE